MCAWKTRGGEDLGNGRLEEWNARERKTRGMEDEENGRRDEWNARGKEKMEDVRNGM